MRFTLALIAALLIALFASACGSDSDEPVTLTIGVRATPEEEVLGEIYAQALRQAGYKVRRNFDLTSEPAETPLEILQKGRISGYSDHLDETLRGFSVSEGALPGDSQSAYAMAKERLAKKGLTAFPPTPFNLSRPVGLLRKTAEERDLKTVSDLRGEAEEMTLLGPTDCHFANDCLSGIEHYYKIYFESISYTYTPQDIARRYKVLEDGKYDAVIFNSTEGRLYRDKDKFVTLEDDKEAFPAGNAIFVTSAEVVEEAGPEFEKAIVKAQKGLTLPVMQRLDAEVELEGKDPAQVAADYLKQAGSPG